MFNKLISNFRSNNTKIDINDCYYADVISFELMGNESNLKSNRYQTVIYPDILSEEETWICLLTGRTIDGFNENAEYKQGQLLAVDTKPLSQWLEEQKIQNKEMSERKLVKTLMTHNLSLGYKTKFD